MRDLQDKVAVVTGAGHGVGKALALECAKQGMHVVAADIEPKPAEEVAAAVRALSRRAIAVEVDVSDRAQVEGLADRAYAEFGAVHLLFNNAGVSMRRKIEDAQQNEWDWIFAVNFWGPTHGVYVFLPRMQAQGGEAHIVNTASMSGLLHRRNEGGIYQSVKHALVAMTNALRSELEADGSSVAISCFCPGGMLTDIENAGRHRQGRFGGPIDLGPRTFARQPNPMLPEAIAPRVLQGVRENRRYIFSHPHTRKDLEAHYAEMLADFDAADRIAKEVG